MTDRRFDASTADGEIRTIQWIGDVDGAVRLIDQTRLPTEMVQIECRDVQTICEAIEQLRVRGAPAIGIAGAMGVVLGARSAADQSPEEFRDQLDRTIQRLRASRPTAVNLSWALDRMAQLAETHSHWSPKRVCTQLLAEALAIAEEDRQMCRAIGEFGAQLVGSGSGVLTHCNAGGLATAGFGTALAVLFVAHQQGKRIHVFVDETRPLLQGSRLTAWELIEREIDTTLICDNTAAQVMKEGRVQLVITGADRIAANGDTANKIGTYGLAVLAQAHGVPFYVAAPASTFDLNIASGQEIPIEQRSAQEVTHGFGRQTAPDTVAVYNPAFDVTPAELIHTIVTNRGLIHPVDERTIRHVIGSS